MNKAANESNSDYQSTLQEIATFLKENTLPVAIAAHIDPDGDAIGSCLGLQRALRKLGKTAQTYASVPQYLQFLVQENEILPPVSHLPEDTVVVILDVDNNDVNRVEGIRLENFSGFVINIDHHGTNKRNSNLNLVCPSQAATAQIITDLVEILELEWDADIANPLLTGIITDTGSFKFSNTTPEVLMAASKLIGGGADVSFVNESLAQHPKRYYQLLVLVLQSMKYELNDLCVTAHVSSSMLESVGASWEDVESYVGMIRSAQGTELAIMFKDYGTHIKISARSRGKASAQNIAIACGGGGHYAAAGATLHLPYEQAYAKVIEEARKELERVGL
ncbi:DHH family phosphoesterase [Deinococcus cellulosilyticus]|uniref:Phosphoesterase n=1 Tax=Deinococcus cellulosilyticus (strain DSM 18568 / NBRC 106333 / KACC 11606 / 5516J-15) TaxID=1223518 RepID=A0A511N4R8_DEIC1|nr:bifunctional oligoribonuclease/PAP phosphatase NrnA [Deinococcus cellulosilyticus]GEM47401.1 phosphoesterase [Deinococcus cellulosilyticus NBRC 106333 = KACC 11606]